MTWSLFCSCTSQNKVLNSWEVFKRQIQDRARALPAADVRSKNKATDSYLLFLLLWFVHHRLVVDVLFGWQTYSLHASYLCYLSSFHCFWLQRGRPSFSWSNSTSPGLTLISSCLSCHVSGSAQCCWCHFNITDIFLSFMLKKLSVGKKQVFHWCYFIMWADKYN